jgi:pantoate--beta-alanine ligase
MKLLRTTTELINWRHGETRSVGFVPTMGNLHEGHISLLEAALKEHPVAVLSIFVNPTQFGPTEDFTRYPRTLDQDLAHVVALMTRHPGREVVVYAPADPAEVYPAGFATVVAVPALSHFLEGAIRPGHFEGVATVVYLLFQLVKPRTAYFGRKDYQQYRVVKRMARDLGLAIHVKGLAIVRSAEGLALSSRNQYLSEAERVDALILVRTLRDMQQRLGGTAANAPAVRAWASEILAHDPRWQYLEVREARHLGEDLPRKGKVVFLGVLKLGAVRLLDNIEGELI